MSIINDIFSGYYSLLVAALVILVPIWFGSFVIQAVGVLFSGRRGSRRAPSARRR